jgi:anthranilate phosphoribosyltransferase
VGIKRGLVVNASYEGQPLDEMTPIGENVMAPAGEVSASEVEALHALIRSQKPGSLEALKGGAHEDNLKIFESVLKYEANSTLLDTICINAGAAFMLAQDVPDCDAGFEKAKALLQSGAVNNWVTRTRRFYQNES